MGTISLESYLANVFITYALQEFSIFNTSTFDKNHYLFYSLVILLGIFIAVSAKRIITVLITEK